MKTRLIVLAFAFLAIFAGTASAATAAPVSIVDYLDAHGMDSSFAARKALAKQRGMENYRATKNAKQNTLLLRLLQESERPEQVVPPPAAVPAEQPKQEAPKEKTAPEEVRPAATSALTTIATEASFTSWSVAATELAPEAAVPSFAAQAATPAAATSPSSTIETLLSLTAEDGLMTEMGDPLPLVTTKSSENIETPSPADVTTSSVHVETLPQENFWYERAKQSKSSILWPAFGGLLLFIRFLTGKLRKKHRRYGMAMNPM